MKNLGIVGILFFCLIPFTTIHSHLAFVMNQAWLKPFENLSNSIMIASTGRSGSTLLTNVILKAVPSDVLIIKTHILPPKKYKGKILFIFSNPDQAAESVLHIMIRNAEWGRAHFRNMESADQEWFLNIGQDTTSQTLQDNLLAYDALGCYNHLKSWLYDKNPALPDKAQILAVKYENLWDMETIEAIKNFLNLDQLVLPPQKQRGYQRELWNPEEIIFKDHYNLGTFDNPKYVAYDDARALWEAAPPFQYLQLSDP